MNCPRCNVELDSHQATRVLLHGCPTCGGVWLDGEASRRVVEAIDPTVVSAADEESRRARQQVDVSRVAPCPVCAQPLQRMPIAQAQVDVDACAQHGVWFDRDELQRVIRAVAPPASANAPATAPVAPAAMAPAVAAPMPAPAAGGGFPAAQYCSPTNEAPAPVGSAGGGGGANVGYAANPAAAFFTDDSGNALGAPAGAPGAPPGAGGGWGLGKTALAVGGGVAAVGAVGYLATHTNLGRQALNGVLGSNSGPGPHGGPSLSDVGSVISRLF